MQLEIPKNVEAFLQAKAAAGGFPSVEAYILSQLDLEDLPPAAPSVSRDLWLHKFDAFIAKQTTRNPQFDDSRESIYPVR